VRLRRRLVEQLEGNGCLTSPAVRSAFLAVPRERFLPEIAKNEGLERVYEDRAIVTTHDQRGIPASSSSQPSMMAAMLEQLDLSAGQRVLEVGAGTGYNAALLARVVGPRGSVVSVELDPSTARGARRNLASVSSRAKVVRGDGREGWRRGAPYDRSIVTASASAVPRAWHDQLAEEGLLELPLRLAGRGHAQAILVFRKQGDGLRSRALLHGGFMPLREAPGAPVPGPPPSLGANEQIDERHRPLVQLSGDGLRQLSATRRRRLLSLALSEPRICQLGVRAPRSALGLYVTLEAPASRLVGMGVISADGGGLALMAGGPKTLTRVESYGDEAAERLLLGLIEEWKQRGRPTASDLDFEVRFRGRAGSKIHWSWGS